MECERCGKEAKEFNILPIPQDDGKLKTITCTDCAREIGLYCSKHDSPHAGFEDGSSACLRCVEEKVAEKGKEIVNSFREKVLTAGVGSGKLGPLGSWILETSQMTGFDPDVVLARGIITVAERLKTDTDEITEKFIKEGPKVIVPWLKEYDPDDFS